MDGVFVVLTFKANGGLEVMFGGPGFTHSVLRYNGNDYAQNRMQRE